MFFSEERNSNYIPYNEYGDDEEEEDTNSNFSDELVEMSDYPEDPITDLDDNASHGTFASMGEGDEDEDRDIYFSAFLEPTTGIDFSFIDFLDGTAAASFFTENNEVRVPRPTPTDPNIIIKRPRTTTTTEEMRTFIPGSKIAKLGEDVENPTMSQCNNIISTHIEKNGAFSLKSLGSCCICFADSDNNTVWNNDTNQIATLEDITSSTSSTIQYKIKPEYICAGPCKNIDHLICTACLLKIITNKSANPINENQPEIYCQYPFSEKCNCCYNTENFKTIIDHAEFEKLKTRQREFRYPGMEVSKCFCGSETLVSRKTIRATQKGNIILQCSSTEACGKEFCYHCQRETSAGETQCNFCINSDPREDPQAWNFYYQRPEVLGGAYGHLLRNYEITEAIAKSQINEIIIMEKLTPKCPECETYMQKTIECNGMTHCNIQKCYVCGLHTTKSGHIDDSHWDAAGKYGCPRYDHHAFWNQVACCNFKCRDGYCHDECSDCIDINHKNGINNMHFHRQCLHVFYLIRSLSPLLRQCILDHVIVTYWKTNGNIVNFLQENQELL